MKQGIYPDLKMEDYLADPCPEPSLSSGIVHMLITDCPAKAAFCHPRLNPSYHEECKDQFDLGTAAHSLFLEGEDIVEVVDADSWRTKAAQEAKEQARLNGKVPLLAAQYWRVKRMVDAANKQLAESELGIKGLLSEGQSEPSILWQEDGTWCRIRPDWLSHDRKVTISYKTTGNSANPSAADRMVEFMGWDIAAAFYLRGIKAVLNASPTYIYMVQEVTEPFLCSFIGMTPEYLNIGEQKVEFAIQIWRECMILNEWPSYPTRVAYIEPKPWALANWEERRFKSQLAQQGTDPTESWGTL